MLLIRSGSKLPDMDIRGYQWMIIGPRAPAPKGDFFLKMFSDLYRLLGPFRTRTTKNGDPFALLVCSPISSLAVHILMLEAQTWRIFTWVCYMRDDSSFTHTKFFAITKFLAYAIEILTGVNFIAVLGRLTVSYMASSAALLLDKIYPRVDETTVGFT